MFIDHLVISGETLQEAVDFVESSLDIRMQEGGRHELFGTHNKLLALDNGLYLFNKGIELKFIAKKVLLSL